jgi:hypothetical protein
VWSDVIVLLSPTSNQGFGFFQVEEDLSIEPLVMHFAIELLDVAVLLGTALFDE